MEKQRKLKVYYDGLCKVCSREIHHYQRQTGADQIEFIDICSNNFDATCEGLDPIQIHKVMHVRRLDGSVATRVDAFIEIWKTLPKYKTLAKVANLAFVKSGLEVGYSLFVRIRPYLPRYSSSVECQNSPYCETRLKT